MDETIKTNKQEMGQITTSTLWSLSANLVEKLIGFVSLAILARLLTPNDFGIVAIASSVVAFADLLNSFGFDWALVRHPAPSKEHYNSAWSLRILLGFITALILFLIAPLAAIMMNQYTLWPLISVLAVSLFIGTCENIGIVDFRRDFSFDREFIFRFWPKVASFILAVGIAVFFRTYWALVLGTLAYRTCSTVISYIMHDFRPRFTLSKASELLSFSTWLLISNIIRFLRDSFANFFIGYTLGTHSTGIYAISNDIANITTNDIASPINRVAFSRYSQHTNQFDLLEDGLISTASIICMVTFPIVAGINAITPEIVALLLGQQWLETINILRILVIAGAFSILMNSSHYVFYARGLTKLTSIIASFTTIIFICLVLVLTKPYGLLGIAIGYLIAIILTLPLNFYLLWKIVGISFYNLIKGIWRSFVAAGSMLLLLNTMFKGATFHSNLDSILSVAVKIPSGVGIYIFLLLGLWFICGKPEGPESFAIRMLKSLYNKAFCS